MTQEEKDLLITDLCSRLKYGVIGRVYAECSAGEYDMISGDMIFVDKPFDVILDGINVSTDEIHVTAIGNEDTVEFIEEQQVDGSPYYIEDFTPYLRPMSSMTDGEKSYYFAINEEPVFAIDWLNAHHFDYRGLIEKGLALEEKKRR